MERLRYINQLRKEQYLFFGNKSNRFSPCMVISSSVIKIVFMITKKFDLNDRTKYIALNLYDIVMRNQFQEFYKGNKNDRRFIQWKYLRNKIINFSKIRLISCIQLASKLDSHCNFMRISQGLAALQMIDLLKNQQHNYLYETLFLSEFSVCKIISFQIPLITPLDCIDVLLSMLNFQHISELRSIALDILDLILIQHRQLFSKLQSIKICPIVKSKSENLHGANFISSELDLTWLSSSIIVCALSFLNIGQTISLHVVQTLSFLTYVKGEKIFLIAFVIRSIATSVLKKHNCC